MRPRKLPLGDQNMVGANITRIRMARGMKQRELLAKLQAEGMEITGSCLSKIEGQTRIVTDKDLVIITRVLGVDPEKLLDQRIE